MKPQLKIAGVCFTGIAIVSLIWFFTPPEFWDWVDGWETWENVKLFVSGLIVGGLFVSIAWLLVLMCAINDGREQGFSTETEERLEDVIERLADEIDPEGS